MPRAGRNRRLHIFHLAQHDDGGADNARGARDIDDCERQNRIQR